MSRYLQFWLIIHEVYFCQLNITSRVSADENGVKQLSVKRNVVRFPLYISKT